jgi:hypothetical protein
MTTVTTAILRPLLAASILLAAGTASAQLVASAAFDAAPVQAGQAAKLTVQFDVMSGTNCGVRVHWGDGATSDFKINQAKDIPLVTTHTYAKAGSYAVKVEPKTVGTTMKCGGRNQDLTLAVAAAPAPVAAGKAAAPAAMAKAAAVPAVQCPDGWKLSKAGVAKKTGAFTCEAKPGTTLPQARLSCPGDLGYFENSKRGQLGCRT